MKYKYSIVIISIILIFSFSLVTFADNGYGYGESAKSLWPDPIVASWSDGGGGILENTWDLAHSDGWDESLSIFNGYYAGSSFRETLRIYREDISDGSVHNITLYPGDVVMFKAKIAVATKETSFAISGLQSDSICAWINGTFNPEIGEMIEMKSEVSYEKERNFYMSSDYYSDEFTGFGRTKCYASIYDISFAYSVPSTFKSVYMPDIELSFFFSVRLNEPIFVFFNDFEWYMGNRDNAPLYDEFENSDSLNNYYAGEDALRAEINDELNGNLKNIFDSSYGIFDSTGDLFAGSLFISQIVNFLFDNTFVGSLITVGLALGIIALTFNLAVSAVGRFGKPKESTGDKYVTINKFYRGRNGGYKKK